MYLQLFSASTICWSVLFQHVKNFSEKPLSEMRWESHVDAVKAVRHQISDIFEALISIVEDDSLNGQSGTKTKVEAKGILYKISNFKFLFSVVFWYDILYEIKVCSKLLQGISIDVETALKVLKRTKSYLEDY